MSALQLCSLQLCRKVHLRAAAGVHFIETDRLCSLLTTCASRNHLHVLFDHQRAVWTVKLFERPQRGVNINPNNHKCQKMESSTQIRFKRHHSSKARVELKQYICISASSSWPATCSHLSSPPDLIPKFVCWYFCNCNIATFATKMP